jgi:prepilin-type N-terminal cleavage/methylation domain-containing protein
MKSDNRGFTMIEMMVCLVIFVIVAAAAYGLMLTGALSFNSVNDNVDMQIKADITLNQLSQDMMNCNTGIAFKSNTLYIINTDEASGVNGVTEYTAIIYQFKDDKCIYFASSPAVLESNGSFSCVETASNLIADHTQSFLVSLVSDTAGVSAVSAKIEASFSRGGHFMNSGWTVALRNCPALITIS